MDGLEALQRILSLYPDQNVIMITGYPTIDTAVHCIKLGAQDYLVKPFRLDDLDASLNKINNRTGKKAESGDGEEGLKIDDLKSLIHWQEPGHEEPV